MLLQKFFCESQQNMKVSTSAEINLVIFVQCDKYFESGQIEKNVYRPCAIYFFNFLMNERE